MTRRDQAPLLRPLASQRVGNLSPEAKIILDGAINGANGAAYLGPEALSPAETRALDELLAAGLISGCRGTAYGQIEVEATDLARSQARDLDQALKEVR